MNFQFAIELFAFKLSRKTSESQNTLTLKTPVDRKIMSARAGLHIDTSGLRRRLNRLPTSDDDDDRKKYVHLELRQQETGMPKVRCGLYVLLWIATLLSSLYYLHHATCGVSTGMIQMDCNVPDYIYTPILLDKHMTNSMKTNYRIKSQTKTAVKDGQFDHTATWKQNIHSIGMNVESQSSSDFNIHIAAVVYSNQFSARIGEVASPLSALYYENSIDQLIIIDDTASIHSSQLWEQEMLFNDESPSKQLKLKDVDDRFAKWDQIHSVKADSKQFVRTSNIGIWRGFERGSRMAYVPKSDATKHKDSQREHPNIELLLLLDTYHQLPMNDEWIQNALSLFEQYPNLQVLGGFSGVIKEGKTFGDVEVGDMRSKSTNDEAKVFVMSQRHRLQKNKHNKRRYDESRLNMVELLDDAKERYFDDYWDSFWTEAQRIYDEYGYFGDDDDGDTKQGKEKEPKVGLWSMNFLDDVDGAVFMDENDPKYDPDARQTGLESIQHTLKKRFLERYEAELEAHLPIPAKVIQKLNEQRDECRDLLVSNPTEEQRRRCEVIMHPGGDTVTEYFLIPYEQRVRMWNRNRQIEEERHIPFMFISSVRLGPIFIRRDWWFDRLLPHLTALDDTMGTLKEEWLDIEISLHTWALGGQVGLYDADGFKFDQQGFEEGLKRNKRTNAEWDKFEKNHHLALNEGWDVWNVSHLVQLNEGEKSRDENGLKMRSSLQYESDNPAHPQSVENSRQIIMTMQAIENLVLGPKNKKHPKNSHDTLIRSKKKDKKVEQGNPLNEA